MNNLNTELIQKAQDEIVLFELLEPYQQKDSLRLILQLLEGYPKPISKDSTVSAKHQFIGAYLYVSNILNTCKLGLLDLENMDFVCHSIVDNVEKALSLLIDK